MKKYRYNIIGLDCANCARNLEEELNKNKDIKNAIVNFSTSKLSYETDKLSFNEIEQIVKKTEPEVTIKRSEEKPKKKYHLWMLILGVLLSIISFIIKMPYHLNDILLIISYIILLYKTFIQALKMFIKSKSINENALITISCVGAYLVGQKMEGVMVVALYLLGKILEEKAINNSRNSIKELINLKQNYANIKDNDSFKQIEVEQIKIGDILLVKKGEKVPVDAIVIEGKTSLDTSSLTGESEPVNVKKNDNIISGTINLEDAIIIKSTSTYEDSTVAKILKLLEEATDKKAKTETLVSKLSKIYTPTILVLAILVAIILPIFKVSFDESIYRALTFLVISCPCAIAISVPLSYFTGIGTCSKKGILIKGSNYLDNLAHINKIIFDKTGTLTNGNFEVKSIKILDKNYSKEEIINILLSGESLSNHPIAKSIINYYKKEVNIKDVSNFKETTGIGIEFDLNKKHIKIGTKKGCNCNIDASIHINIDNKHIASIEINDGIKDNAKQVIKKLKNNNIITYMFTGDKKNVADIVGKTLEIDYIKSEMLPQDKYKYYEKIKKENEIVAFVGDGVNDAPTLKRADIGISMGKIGTNASIEASDVVIMNDDLEKISDVIKISKYTNHIIKQNLIFAFLTKIIILILSVFGITTMWFAVFADTGVTLISILNTIRIMNKYK